MLILDTGTIGDFDELKSCIAAEKCLAHPCLVYHVFHMPGFSRESSVTWFGVFVWAAILCREICIINCCEVDLNVNLIQRQQSFDLLGV
jgi:hypothetical protein